MRSGFLIIEAILALAIAALIIFPSLGLQTTSLEMVTRSVRAAQRLLYAQQVLYQARLDQKPTDSTFNLQKTFGSPPVQVSYQLEKPQEKSSLNKKNVLIEKVYTGSEKKKMLTLLSVAYKGAA